MAGEARRKMMDAARLVPVDFSKVEISVGEADKANLGATGEPEARAAAARFLINRLITGKFPQGLDRKDGKSFGAWQDAMEEKTAPVDMPASEVRWLLKIAEEDALRVDAGLVRWRESLVDYLNNILDTAEPVADFPAPAEN